jgi:hypothetical protein
MGDFNHFPDPLITHPCNLKQVVKCPTRGHNILDKVYTNVGHLYSKAMTLPLLSTSDHNVVILKPDKTFTKRGWKQKVQTRVMGPNERASFANDLKSVNWTPMYHLPKYELQHAFFYQTLDNLINKHFPTKWVIRHTTDKPWVTDNFRYIIRQRQRAFLRKDMNKYHKYRNVANRMAKTLRSNYYEQQVAELKTSDVSSWWRNVKTLTEGCQTNKLQPLQHLANLTSSGDLKALSSTINNYFAGLCADMPSLVTSNTPSVLAEVRGCFIISMDEVEKQLSRINSKKSQALTSYPPGYLRTSLLSWPDLFLLCLIPPSGSRRSMMTGKLHMCALCPKKVHQIK